MEESVVEKVTESYLDLMLLINPVIIKFISWSLWLI